jgi:hypothetical protein
MSPCLMQVVLRLPAPTTTTLSQGGASSVEDVHIRLESEAFDDPDFPAIENLNVEKTAECGDDLCSPGVAPSHLRVLSCCCSK